MRKYLLLVLLAGATAFTLSAQGVAGVISDTAGNPVPYASVFVPELKRGSTSNIEGHYRLELPPGKWQIVIQSIGFNTVEKVVVTGAEIMEYSPVLTGRSYRLPEIKVLPNGEDPAWYIMRRAIALAPYYKEQVSEYRCRVYLKGSGQFKKIPRLLARQMEKQGVRTNQVFSMESISQIEFRLPNQLKQQVLAQRSSGNSNNTSPMEMVTHNLYHAAKYGVVSPFDRQASQVYRFRLVDVFEDQGRVVNRIEVIPRRKGNDVFEGFINIADGFWSLHSADLKLNIPMATIAMKQLYGPVGNNVWMPVSLSFDISFSWMGLGLDYVYLASVSDYQVTLNPKSDHSILTQRDDTIGDGVSANAGGAQTPRQPAGAISGKRKAQIAKLLDKDDLTMRQARQLSRMIEKENAAQAPRPPLEIEQRVFQDSAKIERDSVYWATMRPVPLTPGELEGFRRKDSLIRVQSNPAWVDSVEQSRRRFKPAHLVMGKTYAYHPRGSASRKTFSLPGLAGINGLSFNTVDGLRLTLPFSWHQRDTLGHAWSLEPETGYAFARRKVDATMGLSYTWNGAKRAKISINGGTSTADFNMESGISAFSNDFHSLWYERNYKKLFRRDFAGISQQIEVANGANIRTSVTWADRRPLENHSEYRIIDWRDRAYTPNIPENSSVDDINLRRSRLFEVSASLTITPGQQYTMRHGFKQYISNRQPFFTISAKRAIPRILQSDADFGMVEAGIRQKLPAGVGTLFDYSASAGWFFKDKHLHFSDFRHFTTHYPRLFTNHQLNSFAMNPFYSASTSGWFAEAHFAYEAGRILIKRLPVMANSMVTEQLFVHVLHNDILPGYFETGYALRNIFLFFSLEAVTAFESGRFRSAGLKLGITLPGME